MLTEYQTYDKGLVDVSASGWTHYAGKDVQFAPLQENISVDICVVGAGLAGSALALFLAKGGANVALIEAKEPGWGASGRNAGQVNYPHDIGAAAEALPDRGAGLFELFRQNTTLPYRLVDEYNIDCDARQNGFLFISAHRSFDGLAVTRIEESNKLGFPARYVEGGELAEMTGTTGFRSAAFNPHGGTINPFYFTRGLSDAARSAGAHVFSQSPVTKLYRDGSYWRVACERGGVRAENVVLCTGAYDTKAWPELAQSWYPLTAYAMTTQRLPESLQSTFMPFGGSTQQLPGGHTAVVDSAGRLYTSLVPGLRPHRVREPAAYLRRWLRRFYPQSSGCELEIEAYWTGALAYSSDLLPRIFELGPGLLALNCFSATGNLPAPMVAKDLARGLLDSRMADVALPLQQPQPVAWRNRNEILFRRILVPLNRAAERLRLL